MKQGIFDDNRLKLCDIVLKMAVLQVAKHSKIYLEPDL